MSGRGEQPRRKEYGWENVSLQKLMYMAVYDTLEKMFWKYLKKEKELE